MLISAISQFITGLIHLFLPQVQAAHPEYLILACLCTVVCWLTGEHTLSTGENHLLTSTAERSTALPRSITSTERTNAP